METTLNDLANMINIGVFVIGIFIIITCAIITHTINNAEIRIKKEINKKSVN